MIQETVFLHQRLHLHGLQVHSVDRRQRRRSFGQSAGGCGKKDILAIGRDVTEPRGAVAEGERLHDACGKVVLDQIIAVAPSRLSVVGMDHLVDILSFSRSFLRQGIYQEILGRSNGKRTFRQMFGQYSFLPCDRVYRHQLSAIHTTASIIIAVRTGHPLDILRALRHHLSRSQVRYSPQRLRAAPNLSHAVTQQQILAIRREGW